MLDVFEKCAPVVAASELATEPNTFSCENRLGGQQLIITADPVFADYIFSGNNKGNYVQRPASTDGLQKLGMFGRGLIWNNDLDVWKRVRGCFQRALGESALNQAAAVAKL